LPYLQGYSRKLALLGDCLSKIEKTLKNEDNPIYEDILDVFTAAARWAEVVIMSKVSLYVAMC